MATDTIDSGSVPVSVLPGGMRGHSMNVSDRYRGSYVVEHGYLPWWAVPEVRARVALWAGSASRTGPQAFGRAARRRAAPRDLLFLITSCFVVTAALLAAWR